MEENGGAAGGNLDFPEFLSLLGKVCISIQNLLSLLGKVCISIQNLLSLLGKVFISIQNLLPLLGKVGIGLKATTLFSRKGLYRYTGSYSLF